MYSWNSRNVPLFKLKNASEAGHPMSQVNTRSGAP
jgi:hypothetical protein